MINVAWGRLFLCSYKQDGTQLTALRSGKKPKRTPSPDVCLLLFVGLFVDLYVLYACDEQGGPCGRPDCNVCQICTHGFKLQGNVGGTARRTTIHLRYGEGLYFSSVSGKANDYAHLSEKVWGGVVGCGMGVVST